MRIKTFEYERNIYENYKMKKMELADFLESCLFTGDATSEEGNLNMISSILQGYYIESDCSADLVQLKVREAKLHSSLYKSQHLYLGRRI